MIFGLQDMKQYNGICGKILKCYPEKKTFKIQTELGLNMVSAHNLMVTNNKELYTSTIFVSKRFELIENYGFEKQLPNFAGSHRGKF